MLFPISFLQLFISFYNVFYHKLNQFNFIYLIIINNYNKEVIRQIIYYFNSRKQNKLIFIYIHQKYKLYYDTYYIKLYADNVIKYSFNITNLLILTYFYHKSKRYKKLIILKSKQAIQ